MGEGTAISRALRWGKPVFGLALLALLASQVDVARLAELMQRGELLQLTLALGSFVGALVGFQAFRLHILVRAYTGSIGASWQLFFVGAFFNNLLPSNVGGDAVRLLYLRRRGDADWAGPLSRLVLHRVSGITSIMVAFAAYALLLPGRLDGALSRLRIEVRFGVLTVGVLGLLLLAALLLLSLRSTVGRRLWTRGQAFMGRFAAGLQQVTGGTLVLLAVLTFAFHGLRMVGFYVGASFFGQTIAFWDIVPVLMVTAVVALLPLTVGGLGLVEGSLSVGLAAFGVSTEAAVGLALIHRLALLLVAAIGGLVYAVQGPSPDHS